MHTQYADSGLEIMAFPWYVLVLSFVSSGCRYNHAPTLTLNPPSSPARNACTESSNQFGQQEPGSNAEIQRFAKEMYGVTFPVFGKVCVCSRIVVVRPARLLNDQPAIRPD